MVREEAYFLFFFTKNIFTAVVVTCRVMSFCVAYFPCCFLKMAIKISHSHFVHVAFVSILVFQTFDRMIFGALTFPGLRWYVMTVRHTQMVRDQKKFENHWFRRSLSDKTGQTLTLHRHGTNKQCGT